MNRTAATFMALAAVLSAGLSLTAIVLVDHPACRVAQVSSAPPGAIGASLDADGRWHCPAAYPRVAWSESPGVWVCESEFSDRRAP